MSSCVQAKAQNSQRKWKTSKYLRANLPIAGWRCGEWIDILIALCRTAEFAGASEREDRADPRGRLRSGSARLNYFNYFNRTV